MPSASDDSYVYFVNSISGVQSVKTYEKLLTNAKGFKKMIDAGMNYGLYMHDIIHTLLMFEAGEISKRNGNIP